MSKKNGLKYLKELGVLFSNMTDLIQDGHFLLDKETWLAIYKEFGATKMFEYLDKVEALLKTGNSLVAETVHGEDWEVDDDGKMFFYPISGKLVTWLTDIDRGHLVDMLADFYSMKVELLTDVWALEREKALTKMHKYISKRHKIALKKYAKK